MNIHSDTQDMAILAEDKSMPIAIVGIGCRMPGDSTTPDKLWEFVSQARNAYCEVPKARFNIDAFYHPSIDKQGTMSARGGYFLQEDVALFDAPFFSITPNEAKSMDPQQRLFLEVVYESLENAGIPMEHVFGSQTSCHVGCFTNDYQRIGDRDVDDRAKYTATGTGASILSNRVSWFFDLRGPSMTIDTACSSSLVALHLACQSLRTKESKMALVGGTNIILDPSTSLALSALNFLSPDSKCQSFDHKANGYARGEGFASIVLKPLDDAIRNNDVIRGVIRGSAVNQDGHTPGITLPSMQSQEQLISYAYHSAGLHMGDTGYFEAHGTGTQAGDPLEAGAIAQTVAKNRTLDNPLLIGSIKSNIGHLEGSSGLAGLIKAVYVLEKGFVPATLWFEKENSRIPMEEWKIKVPTELTPYPSNGLRRVSVNSFGFGGTNAHVIVDDTYHYLQARGLKGNHNVSQNELQKNLSNGHAELPNGFSTNGAVNSIEGIQSATSLDLPSPPMLFVWSAQEQSAIDRMGQKHAKYLEAKQKNPQLLGDLSYTLACRRSLLGWRSFFVGNSAEELRNHLSGGVLKAQRASNSPKLAFVFTGQGAQWHAMGRELLSYQVFRSSIRDADKFLNSLGCSWSLLDELSMNEELSNVNKAAYSQPMCTALQIGLVELLKSWGISPLAVIGHSSGEIAAAFTKGAISRESAWKIAFHRGCIADQIPVIAPGLRGSMLAAGVGEEQASNYISRILKGQVVVACINSPSSVTISGDTQGIDELYDHLTADGVFARKLQVDIAYHSHHMRVIAKPYLSSLQGIEALEGNPDVAMFSSVSGDIIGGKELGAQYWVDNMVSPVKFSQASQKLFDHSATTIKKRRRDNKPFVDIVLEVGPHSALNGPLKQILDQGENRRASIAYLSLLRRGENAARTALGAAGELFARGYNVSVAKVNKTATKSAIQAAPLVDLPPYPWNRKNRYWSESYISSGFRFRKHPRHDLLGAPTPDFNPFEPRWRNVIRKSENPWVEDHKVHSNILYPAGGMIVMGIEAARQIAVKGKVIKGYEIRDFNVGKAMVMPQYEDSIETIIEMKPWKLGSRASTSVWQEFSIFSMISGQDWQQNCSGLIVTHYEEILTSNQMLEERARHSELKKQYLKTAESCTFTETHEHLYESFDTLGLPYGPTFRNIVSLKCGDHQAVGVLRVPDIKSIMPRKYEHQHVIHPATLDNVFQISLAVLLVQERFKVAMLPTFIKSLYISESVKSQPGYELHGYSRARDIGFREADGDVVLWGQSDSLNPAIILEGLRVTALSATTDGQISSSLSVSNVRKLCFSLCWKGDVDLVHSEYLEEVSTSETPKDSKVLFELELAAFVYIRRILNKFSAEEAESFAPHHRLLYSWAQDIESKALKKSLNYQDESLDWLHLNQKYESDLLQRVSTGTVDGKMLCLLGENAESILNGEKDALELMLEKDLLYDLYSFSAEYSEINARMKSYMGLLGHKRPGIKILEIGAGTGSSTLPILEALSDNDLKSPRFSSYTFTDISSGFFPKARSLLEPWEPYMNYKSLNIEEDPAAQGFDLGTYDYVIACNVLHATRNIDETLKHVKDLLKPDGRLLLIEPTQRTLRATMGFGWLPGWWLGNDDGRMGGPLLTEDKWNAAFLRNGFSGIEICLRDSKNPQDRACSFLVTKASPQASPKKPSKILVIHAINSYDAISLGESLVTRLSQVGYDTDLASLKGPLPSDLRDTTCIVLAEVHQPVMLGMNDEDFKRIKTLCLNSSSVLWVTRGGAYDSPNPEAIMFVGLSRSIRSEHPNLTLTTLDLDPADNEPMATVFNFFQATNNLPLSDVQDSEYAVRNSIVLIPRLLAQNELNAILTNHHRLAEPVKLPFLQYDRSLKLSIGVPGVLDTLQFVDDLDALTPIADDELEIKVMAVGLNFRDVMLAMNRLPETELGVECSGVVTKTGMNVENFSVGDRVLTFRAGCHRTSVRNSSILFQRLPEDMSFEVAATIPAVYATVYVAFIDTARLRKGESVLIHAAAGGIGQAAIQVAQYIGAEIFATVGSEEKKRLIMREYNIPEDHIFDSRNLSFAQGVKRMTNGKGVNVVLNSLSGEFMRETWNCLALFGRFIELGKKDILDNTGLDMAPFIGNRTFAGVNLLLLFDHNPLEASRILAEVMNLLRSGAIKAVAPVTVYPYSGIEEAFRFMQAGKHMGKVILKANDSDIVPILPPERQSISFNKKATYVLVGGLGGLGRTIARWMVDRGAVNLVFLSRSGTKKEEARKLIEELNAKSVNAHAFSCDVADRTRLQEVLDQCAEILPPIKGVIQGAMVVQNSLIENMTSGNFAAALAPKVLGSWNLHNLLPESMDFFVMLSSAAGIVGAPGQANYNAGNTYQDALAHFRRGIGLPATSIDLGAFVGIGYIAEEVEDSAGFLQTLRTRGVAEIHEKEFLSILSFAMTSRGETGAHVPTQIITGLITGGMRRESKEVSDPLWSKDAKFRILNITDLGSNSSAEMKGPVAELHRLLAQVTSLPSAAEVISTAIGARLARTMQIPVEDVDISKPINAYGVDSLVAVEMRNWIFGELKADISIFDILSNAPISALSTNIASKSSLVPSAILEEEA